ncbi:MULTISPECIES: fumarylacetoacetate hydrolase family protein [Pseudonocardia]|uniref:Ureidoglycolate lyase n=2 Tax=Pseudonocardia TaxID=1847 RepID=A0A1Y2MKN6_PSEAH|nr:MULTISPECIES: fumarylacetoacetate hydrolase family protein [Pseudonocardia]OSY35820.1 Ureidoglycolate lyase [Pseudonocardia autotrophica]TDN73114.1 acylpyruvate hydrolase [Pseudonocardia autotrophica]BBG03833.1 2-hydroxyhepta-2,4-diene-1,7-dioate isomerase [Pseudonocardia autotrophica]GEC27368.1 2-hydroxyhepta-2,4-diene-1,7-dioate isomerase [Pseudonocardia saturnea]
MKLATLTTPQGTSAARLDGDHYRLIDGFADVGALLADPGWETVAAAADGPAIPAADASVTTLVPHPGAIVCVGLNYRSHILEMGRDLPGHPTLFAKFERTLTAPYADIEAVPEDPELDWEGELVIVIGTGGRRIAESDAAAHIAGYTLANDISMRGWQMRTKEWLQGKAWEASTPVGPVLATADEIDTAVARLATTVNDETVQDHAIADLVFDPAHLVSYISTMMTLQPGDLILTGTPGGVGRARNPQVYLKAGDEVRVAVPGIGELRNRIVAG